MQHRQATTSVEGRRDGRRSIARTLPGLSVEWVASRPGCIRPPSLCVSQAILPPVHSVPPRILSLIRSGFGLAPIPTRERRDGPFTIDTIVAASWPSPLRRRSLVSSTDSICPPRGCLITGRRVDRGRARQKGRRKGGEVGAGCERQRGRRRVASERPREKRDGETTGWTTKKEEERVHSNSPRAHTTDNPVYRCIGAAGSAATKTLTE